jgi:hypothetical protein
MKTYFRRLVLGALFIAITAMGYSQFTLGPKVGINFSNISQKTEMKLGFNAGFFFRIGTSFYFQPEVDYSFRSSTLKGVLGELQEDARLKNHYIDVPLLVGYKFVDNPNFNFRAFIGPRLGILISTNVQTSKNNSPIGKVQIGGRTGIGIDFWRFMFDVSYDFSASKDKYASSKWWQQNMIDISLGFKILEK